MENGALVRAHVPLRFARLLTPMRQTCVTASCGSNLEEDTIELLEEDALPQQELCLDWRSFRRVSKTFHWFYSCLCIATMTCMSFFSSSYNCIPLIKVNANVWWWNSCLLWIYLLHTFLMKISLRVLVDLSSFFFSPSTFSKILDNSNS